MRIFILTFQMTSIVNSLSWFISKEFELFQPFKIWDSLIFDPQVSRVNIRDPDLIVFGHSVFEVGLIKA